MISVGAIALKQQGSYRGAWGATPQQAWRQLIYYERRNTDLAIAGFCVLGAEHGSSGGDVLAAWVRSDVQDYRRVLVGFQ